MDEDMLPRRETSAELVQTLYGELDRAATHARRCQGEVSPPKPADLIRDTFLKLHKVEGWTDREHFLRAAAAAMRRLRVDAARTRLSQAGSDAVDAEEPEVETAEAFAAIDPASKAAADKAVSVPSDETGDETSRLIDPATLSGRIAADEHLLKFDAVLARLQAFDPRLAQVVECHYFAGYADADTAQALAIVQRSVRRDWLRARAWLYAELQAV